MARIAADTNDLRSTAAALRDAAAIYEEIAIHVSSIVETSALPLSMRTRVAAFESQTVGDARYLRADAAERSQRIARIAAVFDAINGGGHAGVTGPLGRLLGSGNLRGFGTLLGALGLMNAGIHFLGGRGLSGLSVGVGVSKGRFWGIRRTTSRTYGIGPTTATLAATGSAGASVNGGANVKLSADGLDASASASARAGAWGSASATVGSERLNSTTTVSGFVGAEAQASARASLGLDGAALSGQAGAFVGGSVGVEEEIRTGGVTSRAGAGVSYGIGAEAKGGVTVRPDHIKVEAKAKLVFGLGGELSFSADVNPREVAADVDKAVDQAAAKIVGRLPAWL